MLALMIAYCTGMSLKKCTNTLGVKDDDDCSGEENSKKGPLAKVSWYLLIIPRFKCLFTKGDNAKYLTRHANGRDCDGILHHLADSS